MSREDGDPLVEYQAKDKMRKGEEEGGRRDETIE